MDTTDPFFRHTATADNGAGFRAERSGGLAMLTPLTASAETWLRTHVGPDASWSEERLVVEMRYFPALADAAIAAGFTFERDPLPS